MSVKKGQTLQRALVGLAAVACFLGIMASTSHGIGVSPDSIVYLGGARSILEGNGFSMPPENEPITHHAPLYSFLLAMTSVPGIDPAQSARWTAGALFCFNVLLMFLLVGRIASTTGQFSSWFAVGAAGLVASGVPMWEVHLMAWTEPLFAGLLLVSLLLLTGYLESGGRARLTAAGLTVALSILTRYAGLAVWGAFSLVLLVFPGRSRPRRASDVLLFSALCLSPFLMWSLRNYSLAGTATSRTLSFHPISSQDLKEGLTTVASWLLVPEDAGGLLKLGAISALFVLAAGGMLVGFRKGRLRKATPAFLGLPPVVFSATIAAAVYSVFLIASKSLFDANTPLDNRILAPLFVLLIVPLAFGLASWEKAHDGARPVILGVFCLGFAAHMSSSYPVVVQSLREGAGFNHARWRSSELIQELKNLKPSTPVYSNSPNGLHFLTSMEAKRIPTLYNRVTLRENPNFQREVDAMMCDIENGGLLIVLNVGGAGAGTGVAEMLIQELQLAEMRSYPEGRIYRRR